MLVVLPVCAKDEHLALLNLQLCRKLDGRVDFDCLVSCEMTFDGSKVVAMAREYFRKVYTLRYPSGSHRGKYPEACNWAWQQAARGIQQIRQEPWLWWEPDAVPVRAGWLYDISASYPTDGKRFFAGTIVRNGVVPQPYLAGVAVYPPLIQAHAPSALSTLHTPFDVCMSTVDRILPKVADISGVIHHEYDPGGGGWVKGKPIPDVALYHRCKSGELQKELMGSGSTRVNTHPDILTVVITTHNRMGRLKRALTSCLDAGVKHVVITATGYTRDDCDELSRLSDERVTVILNRTDRANPAWVAGVEATATKWVHILHDDDILLPQFLEITPHLEDSFAYFSGKFHKDKDSPTYLCSSPDVGVGRVQTRPMQDFLKEVDNLSITPVRGVFKRDDLLLWLREAESLLPKACYLRSGFLVGNDLWIWLSATSKYGTLYSHPTPLVSLGCDEDSTTTLGVKANGAKSLKKIYNVTRRVFFREYNDTEEGGDQVRVMSALPLHILTIVLDGAPWLLGQLQVFNRLRLDWRWTIVEGVAAPTHCTSWCKGIDPRSSVDGTSSILSDLSLHRRIRVISKTGWDGKLEMVNSALEGRDVEEILLEVDVDEFWEAGQIEEMVRMFESAPDNSHAMFWCRYFVGPGKVMLGRNCYANNPTTEWRRAWRRKPGQRFLSHEPPMMSGSQSKFFTHGETEARGLVFDHYSYVLSSQVGFKEVYYGYPQAVEHWTKLQQSTGCVRLGKYFPWAATGGMVTEI